MSASAPVYTDFAGLDRLRAGARSDPQGNLRAVAQQFEGLFVQMVLKSMRDASLGNGLFDNDQSRLYQDMSDGQLSTTLAGRGGVGLTDVIMRQLGGKPGRAPAAAPPLPPVAAPPRPVAPAAPVAPVAVHPAEADVGALDQPLKFVRAIWDHARSAAAELGTQAKVLVAQAALETGWGRHVPQRADGASSNNLFGIKAGSQWPGASAAVPTLEYRDGVLRRENASFRAYDTLADGFDDYVQMLKSNPRFRSALAGAADPRHYATALQSAGYATDPGYGQKILGIYHSGTLDSAIEALKP